jgi:3-oxoacyl-(acyl-carrier-protein) synthase
VVTSPTPSILAASWFCAEDHGVIAKDALVRQSPLISDSKEMTALIDRPLKYFPRMTAEARSCLAAASLAIKAAGWHQRESVNIGIVGTGYTGCLLADMEYFRDYVAGGQSLGRANLFIYTLPTSALSEVAIALNLTGPTLHVCDDAQPMQSVIQLAMTMVKNREAQGMLCEFSDGPSAICVAIGIGEPVQSLNDLRWNQSPAELCRRLAAMVPKT